MKKGIILEIDNKYVTVLTPEGEFHKARRGERPYEIGAEISFTPIYPKMRSTSSFFPLSVKKTSIIVTAAAVILGLSILPGTFDEKVSAYMTIDVNPSIELALDDDLEIVDVKGLNKEGKEVVEHLALRDKHMKEVTEEIVSTINKLGYFKEHRKIVVSTTMMDKDKDLEKELKKQVTELNTSDLVPRENVKIINATTTDRNMAKQKGLSTGKYVEKKLVKGQNSNGSEKRQSQKENENQGTASNPVKEKENTQAKPNPEKQTDQTKVKMAAPRHHVPDAKVPEQPKPGRPGTATIKKPSPPSAAHDKHNLRERNEIKLPERHKVEIPDKNQVKNKLKDKEKNMKKNIQQQRVKRKDKRHKNAERTLELHKRPDLLKERHFRIFDDE